MNTADVDLFFPEYSRAVRSLKRAFVSHKGIPLTLIGQSNFYSSTTATALLALDRVGALSTEERQDYRSTLLRLRSGRVNSGDVTKRREDEPAWDAQEGASVWNTSGAIWALARTGYRGPEIDRAVRWIIEAYNRDDDFSPLRDDVNLFIAANVAQGLRIAGAPHLVQDVLQGLLTWVRRTGQSINGTIGWANTKDGVLDPTATLSALWLLHDCGDKEQDARMIVGAKNFLRSALRGSHGIWPMTTVYSRPPYLGLQPLVIHSYTPSFIIPLLRMGVDPFDPMVLEPIRWLRANVISDPRTDIAGWDSAGHRSVPLTFTTAYAVWAIHNWAQAVARSARDEIKHDRAPTVFIVHGRDPVEHREEIRTHLRQWNCPDPVLVVDEPASFDTIFARVTQAALLCDYAIVLATPDDVGTLASAPQLQEPRARQNVILELGLFLGLYRRNRVSLLTCGDVTLPSDLDGVLRIDMERPGWSEQLHNSLRVAGVCR